MKELAKYIIIIAIIATTIGLALLLTVLGALTVRLIETI